VLIAAKPTPSVMPTKNFPSRVNFSFLGARSVALGAELVRVERVADDADATREAFVRALADADLVLCSGGVSVGPHDHVKPALLDAYDDASDQIIDGLRGNSISDADLQAIHKALARLRLAFEEHKP